MLPMRVTIKWHHLIDKDSLKINSLERKPVSPWLPHNRTRRFGINRFIIRTIPSGFYQLGKNAREFERKR
jgi:hypothetical protein